MFSLQIKELYKFLTKKELTNSFSINKLERKSTVQYIFNDYEWLLVPTHSILTKENYKTVTNVIDKTYIFFINDFDFTNAKYSSMCRQLTKEDQKAFDLFKDSCSKEDKEEGMVSLSDDFVYGLFENNKLVAVSSLWNWGDIISDIGILVHPNYRNKGYAKATCQALMNNIDKKFVWRCSKKNEASFKLAISLGFTQCGLINELEIDTNTID